MIPYFNSVGVLNSIFKIMLLALKLLVIMENSMLGLGGYLGLVHIYLENDFLDTECTPSLKN